MWFRENVTAQLTYLEREQERISNQLRVLPKEKLIKKCAHGKEYYYFELKGKRVSLQGNPKVINEYLFRDNLQRQLRAIEQNIPLLHRIIKRYRPLGENNSDWTSIEPRQNTNFDDHRAHVWNGIAFLSKSEMLIAMALHSYGIDFKYESKLYVNGRYIYPDFVIKRPKDGKIFIWEPNYKKSSLFLNLIFYISKSLNKAMLNRRKLNLDNSYLSFAGSNVVCCVSNA